MKSPRRTWAGGVCVVVSALALSACTDRTTDAQVQRTASASYNGFDVSNASIPAGEIFSGGPGRDGIPAILAPKFIDATQVDFLKDDDLVMSVSAGGETRAYPHRIIVWHEIVNDTIAGEHFAVTYCPLCGTSMVFDRAIDGEVYTFGVSGLLYQSDVLMYDHQTESLWSQLQMEAVTGPMRGTTLEWLPSDLMTWEAWRKRHPDGTVLSTDTGHRRAYNRDAYARYMNSPETMFPVPERRTELSKKAWVIGVIVDGVPKAYPVETLEELAGDALRDTVNGQDVEVRYDADAQWARVIDAESGDEIPNVRVYWFAWQAFYPKTKLYER